MIRAIIFDCFGVLTTDGWLPYKKKYFGHDQKLMEEATDLNKQCDSGHMSYENFVTNIANLANVPESETQKQIESNVSNHELFEVIENLKPQYKIGMLSNAGANWLSQLFSAEQVKLFDAVSLSCETGHVKPDPLAYQAIVEQLGVQLDECVFVDDQERYCTAARELGIQAVVYKDLDQLKSELLPLLDTPLTD